MGSMFPDMHGLFTIEPLRQFHFGLPQLVKENKIVYESFDTSLINLWAIEQAEAIYILYKWWMVGFVDAIPILQELKRMAETPDCGCIFLEDIRHLSVME